MVAPHQRYTGISRGFDILQVLDAETGAQSDTRSAYCEILQAAETRELVHIEILGPTKCALIKALRNGWMIGVQKTSAQMEQQRRSNGMVVIDARRI